jgi:hypothetical protein
VVVAAAVADNALPRRPTDPLRLRLEPFSSDGEPGRWFVRWRIQNEGSATLQVKTAVQPHTQFHTAETPIGRDIAAQRDLEITLHVRFVEDPGTVVENAFLILLIADGAAEWRVLARVRVIAGPRGEPTAGDRLALSVNRVGALEESVNTVGPD